MNRVVIIVLLLAWCHLSRAAEYDDPIDGGRSPDGQMVVVNIHNGEGGYFVIRDASGTNLFSEQSIQDEQTAKLALAACAVLWRSDSQYEAVAFNTTKFAVETVVLRRVGTTLQRVSMPAIDPFDWEHAEFGTSDNTHRMPYKWRKNGDLVMDVTTGYHTKAEPGITGYYMTIHFVGNPSKGVKSSRTKTANRD